MRKFKQRWGIQSNFQLFIIIVVFAITGTTSAWLSHPFCSLLGIEKDNFGKFWFTIIRLLFIFPIYQVLLVFIGFLFGQFRFFWAFEKKMLRKMRLGFLLPKEEKEF